MYKIEVSHYSMENSDKKFLVPWDHIRVPGDPIRDPRVPRCPENIFFANNYCTVVINSRFYYIKSKDSVFLVQEANFGYRINVSVDNFRKLFLSFSVSFIYRL